MHSIFTVRTEAERNKDYREKERLRSLDLTEKQSNKNRRTGSQKISWLWRTGTLDSSRISLQTKILKCCPASSSVQPKGKSVAMHMQNWGTWQAGIFSHPHSSDRRVLTFNKSPWCRCSVHILTTYLFWTCFSWDSWVWQSHCIVSLLSQFEMCIFCNFFLKEVQAFAVRFMWRK